MGDVDLDYFEPPPQAESEYPELDKDKEDDEPTLKKPRVSRWSNGRFYNPKMVTYIPPELFSLKNGEALQLLMLRSQIEDLTRIQENNLQESYFRRRKPMKVDAIYNSAGDLVNTHDVMIKERKKVLVTRLMEKSKLVLAPSGGSSRQLIKKIYFTEDQMQTRAYGAILGARGATHQELEKSTGCKLVLAGRGISDMKKPASRTADDLSVNEAPHAMITAPNEEALQKMVEKIDWILGDSDDALAFREEKRKQVAISNGTYVADKWEDRTHGGAGGSHRGAAANKFEEEDADLAAFLNDVGK